MRLPLSRAAFLLVAALIVPACSSSHGGAPPVSLPPLARFAYVANNDGTISGYFVDTQSGQLSPAGFAAAYTGAAPSLRHQLALAPGGQLAWALRTGVSPTISSYLVNSVNGALTSSSVAAPLAGIGNATALAIDPGLRFGYVVDGSVAGFVQAYSLSGTGVFTALGVPVSTGPGTTSPGAIAVTPNGALVYVLNNASATVAGFTAGSLVPFLNSPFVTGATPVDIQIDPTGLYAFVLCQGSPSIWVYSINYSTGALTTVAGSPFPIIGFGSPTYLGVDPLSRFVWAGNATGKVAAFSLDTATGFLSASPGGVFTLPVAGTPLSLTVDPSGQLGFISMSGGSIITLGVAANGTLNGPPPPAPSTIALASVRTRGTIPSAVALIQSTSPVLRTPTFAYVASSAGLTGFSITGGTGVLTPLVGSPFFAGTSYGSVTVDPYGRYAYATQTGAPSVPIGQFTFGGGTLSPIAAPQSIGSATQILADPSGQFVYVASAGTLTSYPIAPLTGALGAGTGASFPGARSLVADPMGSFLLLGGTSNVTVVEVDAATGAPGTSFVLSASPASAIAISPSGQNAYTAATNVITFSGVTSGPSFTTNLGSTTTIPLGNVLSMTTDSTGLLLYVASDAGLIFVYSVDPASPVSLTLVGTTPTSPGAAISLSTDPAGTFLYASSAGNGSLWSYTPGGFGGSQLLSVPGTPILVGASPSAAAITPVLQ